MKMPMLKYMISRLSPKAPNGEGQQHCGERGVKSLTMPLLSTQVYDTTNMIFI